MIEGDGAMNNEGMHASSFSMPSVSYDGATAIPKVS